MMLLRKRSRVEPSDRTGAVRRALRSWAVLLVPGLLWACAAEIPRDRQPSASGTADAGDSGERLPSFFPDSTSQQGDGLDGGPSARADTLDGSVPPPDSSDGPILALASWPGELPSPAPRIVASDFSSPPEYGSAGHGAADYASATQKDLFTQALHGGLAAGGGGLVAKISLAQLLRRTNRRAAGIALPASSFSPGIVSNDETASWIGPAREPSYRALMRGAKFGSTSVMDIDSSRRHGGLRHPEAARAIQKALGVADGDMSFMGPYPPAKPYTPASVQAEIKRVLDDVIIKRGYGWRYLTPWNEPYVSAVSARDHVRLHQAAALAVKTFNEAHGTDVRVGASCARAPGSGHQSAGPDHYSAYQFDVLRNYATYFDVHVYQFKNIKRSEFKVGNGKSMEWVVAENLAYVNRLENLGRWLDTFGDGVKRMIVIGEWGGAFDEHQHEDGAGPRLGWDFSYLNSGMLGVMYMAIRLMYQQRITNLHESTYWALSAAQGPNGAGERVPKTGIGQLLPTWSAAATTMKYWAYRKFNEYLGDAIVTLSGSCPFYQGVSNNSDMRYNFGAMGPAQLAALPIMPTLATINRAQDKVFLIVANADETTARDVSISLDGVGSSALTLASAEKLQSPGDFLDDVKPGGRFPSGVIENASGAGFVSDFSGSVATSGASLTWRQPPFSLVFLQLKLNRR